jgi:phenylacetic acid degradation operon negative regulatory protein
MFIVNTSSNITPDVAALGIEPLSARSIILSVLLGTHPPLLSGRSLIGLAELFDIRPGTVRTALSRMTASGELLVDDGAYALGPRMLQRQHQQDEGRNAPEDVWNGRWFTAITTADRRSVAERRSFRSAMIGARMAELRPDIWMRPANIVEPDRPEDVIMLVGVLSADDPIDLVEQLWPLSELNRQSNTLRTSIARHRNSLDDDGHTVLANTFALSAAAVRFLRVEPQLPDELVPPDWDPPRLRAAYDDFELAFQSLLRTFLHGLS